MKHLPDLVCLTGISMLGYGLWLYLPWVSYSVCGSLLIAGGLLMGRDQ